MQIDVKGLYDTIIRQLSSFWKIDDIDDSKFLADIGTAANVVFLYYLSSLIGKFGGEYSACR